VAAFDFDGTLVTGDSLLPWLGMACGRLPTAIALAGALAGALRHGGLDRDALKADLLSRLLGGWLERDLAAHAQDHAANLVHRLRPQMLGHIRRHQAAGDWVVIVSASPELYLAPVGKALSVDSVLGTRLEVGSDGRLTGRLDGANCRGPEKVTRLKAWMDTLDGPTPTLCAYGDSSGDKEMMALAEVSTWVGRRSWAAR
jgi:phosphatidylglycerophosphatase C